PVRQLLRGGDTAEHDLACQVSPESIQRPGWVVVGCGEGVGQCAGGPAVATRNTGAGNPSAANAPVTASATAGLAPAGTSAIADPPNPPPVIRAPSAPACRAARTATSSWAAETS